MGLKLTRKHGQCILLLKDGKAIARVTLDTEKFPESSRVGLYIEAPDDIKIMRGELLEGEKKEGEKNDAVARPLGW